jgi:hypothetical protein
MGKTRIVDITNQRFDKLLVEKRIGSKCKMATWQCLCDCGNKIIAYGSFLRTGRKTNCGCNTNSLNSKSHVKIPHLWNYNRLKYSSRLRGIEFDMNFDDFLTFTNINKCHYCQRNIIWYENQIKNKSLNHRYNLDRKNNNIGYTLQNCVVCCFRCNRAKNNSFTYDEWYGMTEYFRRKS